MTAETHLIYVLLPEDLEPEDRESRYGDPLDRELREAQLGYVSGGGSQLGKERADGTRPVKFCGVDVEAYELDQVLDVLRDRLPGLGCPDDTHLQYRRDDNPLQDEYDGRSWLLALPRSMMHPGFGV